MRALSAVWLTTLVTTLVAAAGLCVLVRRRPGWPSSVVNGVLAAALVATSGLWLVTNLSSQRFSAATSLPFALCDLATLVAAAALLTRQRLLVELTYFWGLAGSLQSLLTPDLSVPFPHLVFFEYVVAHAGIVSAALVLVVGERRRPGPRAVGRIFLVTLGYTAVVGLVDVLTGGDYMYLRRPPGSWTLLDALGPWPWYLLSAAGVALVLFSLLDLPFMLADRGSWSRRPVGEGRGRPGGVGAASAATELPPPAVGDHGQLGQLPAFPGAERRSLAPDDDARA
ncbi:MAG TPA: TIGR02206 family membrane protein [Acidimicrobiales bacterium]|nr:TIGR02206 family membrane protein [Acidimicrobiales bacterium]